VQPVRAPRRAAPRSLNGTVQWRISLIDGQLDKDQPTERLHWSMHAQHVPSLDVVRHERLSGWRCGAFRERRLDLREPRYIASCEAPC
jgi:hypothetical protein